MAPEHKELTAAEYEAEATAKWHAELIRRYEANLPLTAADKKTARELIANAAQPAA